MHNHATIVDKLQRYTEAESIYLQTIQSKRKVLGSTHPSTTVTILRLAAMYQRQGRFAEAESQLTAALNALATSRGLDASAKPIIAQLESLYEAWGKPAKIAELKTKVTK